MRRQLSSLLHVMDIQKKETLTHWGLVCGQWKWVMGKWTLLLSWRFYHLQTQPALEQHVHRAHFQAAIWRAALYRSPPQLNPLDHGWIKGREGLRPICTPKHVPPAPEQVLKLIKCGCSSSNPCSTSCCSCSSAKISCSVFCNCTGGEGCKNSQTVTVLNDLGEDDG